jgi:hypothetical protein
MGPAPMRREVSVDINLEDSEDLGAATPSHAGTP